LGYEAFRWTASGGMVGLGMLPGATRSLAYGVSGDGLVVVGQSGGVRIAGEAFRWTADGGMVGLGAFPTPWGPDQSVAYDVSADGSVVVGQSGGLFAFAHAFRWTADGGMVDLGKVPGAGSTSIAYGVSANGSVVVGRNADYPIDLAFIWDATNGMRSLQDVLINDYGLDLTGWTLEEARDISDDGRTIVGIGTGPSGREGWIAVIPEPGTGLLLAVGLAAFVATGRRRPRH
jgi:probable HAF family extracellular repeat protein